LQEFLEYLDKFPNNELSGNAQYWIGEIYYAQGEFNTAIEEFRKVITNYPQSKKAVAALLKMGYCSMKLDDLVNARIYFLNVTQQYPNSEEACLAKLRLDELR